MGDEMLIRKCISEIQERIVFKEQMPNLMSAHLLCPRQTLKTEDHVVISYDCLIKRCFSAQIGSVRGY